MTEAIEYHQHLDRIYREYKALLKLRDETTDQAVQSRINSRLTEIHAEALAREDVWI